MLHPSTQQYLGLQLLGEHIFDLWRDLSRSRARGGLYLEERGGGEEMMLQVGSR